MKASNREFISHDLDLWAHADKDEVNHRGRNSHFQDLSELQQQNSISPVLVTNYSEDYWMEKTSVTKLSGNMRGEPPRPKPSSI